MPRFSANLSLLYTELPFIERFEAAARSGFRSVEFMFPYEHAPAEIVSRLRESGLSLDLFNLPAGDFAAGERGVAADPARRDEFRAGVRTALEYADATGTRKINCLVGLRRPDLPVDDQLACLADNLAWAAAEIGGTGRLLLVEQLNPVDAPGFLLGHLGAAESMLDRVASPTLRLQFDVYHVQRAGGDVVASLRRLIDRVGHVQIADSPDRHEPGTGELSFGFILGELDRLGYTGRVGLEYRPSGRTEDSFSWMEAHGWHVDV